MSIIEPIRHPPPQSKNWAVWEWADIPSKRYPGVVYLRRLRVFNTPRVSVFVHWIYEQDTDRDPHDHPWHFWSFVLRGGYREQVFPWPGHRRHRSYVLQHNRWSMHRFPTGWAHKISQVKPGTVTLVVTGPRRRTWGFWSETSQVGQGVWVSYRHYLGEVDVPS